MNILDRQEEIERINTSQGNPKTTLAPLLVKFYFSHNPIYEPKSGGGTNRGIEMGRKEDNIKRARDNAR